MDEIIEISYHLVITESQKAQPDLKSISILISSIAKIVSARESNGSIDVNDITLQIRKALQEECKLNSYLVANIKNT